MPSALGLAHPRGLSPRPEPPPMLPCTWPPLPHPLAQGRELAGTEAPGAAVASLCLSVPIVK